LSKCRRNRPFLAGSDVDTRFASLNAPNQSHNDAVQVLSRIEKRESVEIDAIDDEKSAERQRLAENGWREVPRGISAAGTPVATASSATTPITSFDIAGMN